MAFIINIDLSNGISVENSYARIDTVGGSKERSHISIHYFKDKIAYEEGKELLKEDVFDFIPSVEEGSENWIKQGYEYLKTLQLFTDAVDDI